MSSSTSLSHPDAIPMDVLVNMSAEFKYGHGKALGIIRATNAILSVISSVALIRMITKSMQSLSTTSHRILLGMFISDIFYSLPMATFQSMAPSDVYYMVWNARGNQASCTANGFFIAVGAFLTLCYSCSLNIFYLTKVKYNKTDSYIRTKIEPFLHGIPCLVALIGITTAFVNDNYNDLGGVCSSPVYNPPHCIGYEDGEVREGFTIPCGRGNNAELVHLSAIIITSAVPIIILVSLGMLYGHVIKQEKSMARFAVGDVINQNKSNSRAVLNKALAYSIAYFLAWGWVLVANIMRLAEVEEVPMWFDYLWSIFNPLQGLYNLLIFIHPKVIVAKKARGVYLPRAFAIALWAGLTGGYVKRKPKDVSTPRNTAETARITEDESNLSAANLGGRSQNNIQLSITQTHCRLTDDIEEEKTEIQAPPNRDDFVENPASADVTVTI